MWPRIVIVNPAAAPTPPPCTKWYILSLKNSSSNQVGEQDVTVAAVTDTTLMYIYICTTCVTPHLFIIACSATGEELLTEFCKPESKCKRSFCSSCGSRILNRIEGRDHWLGFFPALLDEAVQHNLPSQLTPKKHNLSVESVLNLDHLCDGLPRE